MRSKISLGRSRGTGLGADAAEARHALQEKAKLRRSFGRLDVFFFLVCTLVGVDGLGALTTKGGAAFTWMIGSVILFAVPSALLIAEMAAAYTDEGGPYIWVRMAVGRLPAAMNNFFYWVSNPVWVGGTLAGTAAGALSVFFRGGAGFAGPATYVIGLLFIWSCVVLTIFSVRVAKWVVAGGAVARFALFGVFTVVVLTYGIEHGFHGVSGHSLVPTFSGFTALVPLILFSLVGFELPSAAGEEIENPVRDVPAGIARTVLASGALYGLPVLGILLVLPVGQASGLAGFADAVRQALTVFGGRITGHGTSLSATLTGFGTVTGWVMGALIVAVAFTSGLTWVMGSDRAMAVSCLDGAGPRELGSFSARFGTPVRVNIMSGLVATGTFVATELITGGNAFKFFTVALSLAISTTLMSYLAMFPSAWVLRRRRPTDPRPFRAPAIGLMTTLSTVLVIFCTIESLCPGLGGGWFDAQNLPGPQWHPSERWTYLAGAGGPLLVFLLMGAVFWLIGRLQGLAGEREAATGPSA
ncbi:MAG TPA: APC family permease [Streptosporangiaceae bacterium]|nr:APC family permease [Streptosporangiaceae bacterium]